MNYIKNVSNEVYITTTEPKMANQASNTVYEITIWSGGTNHNTEEEDGCPD